MKRIIAKYQLVLFFTLAFLITWSVQIPVYMWGLQHGVAFSNEDNFFHFLNLISGQLQSEIAFHYLLVSFLWGPTIAGIIVTGAVYGRNGLQDLLGRSLKVLLPLKWYIFALLIPIGLNVVSLLIGLVSVGFIGLEFEPLVPLALFFPFFLYLLVFTGVAEELGWRGYALPELQKKYDATKASWILGIAWGLWHLPSNLILAHSNGLMIIPFLISLFAGLTLGTVGWTIVLTWFYNNTKSVFLIILVHGLGNVIQSYILLSSNIMTAQIVYGILPWVIAAYLSKKYGEKTLSTLNE